MDFTINNGKYDLVIPASTPFNVHLERAEGGYLAIYKRTSGEGWSLLKTFPSGAMVIDFDIYNAIEREYKIVSSTEPTMCEVTYGVLPSPDVPIPPKEYESYTAVGDTLIRINKARANSVTSLVVDGGCEQRVTPTPTAPIVINCNKGAISYGVQGNNLLEVREDNIIVGKYINNNGIDTESLPNCYFQRFVAVQPNQYYTLSTSESLNYANFMEYDANGVFIKRTLYGSSATPAGNKVRHLMGETTAFVVIGSNVNSAKYPEITKEDVMSIKWMLNKGQSALPYEEYRAGFSYNGEDIITIDNNSASAEHLLGIGEYADTQDIINGAVTRKVGIRVFDGSESSWYLSMSGDVYRYRYKFNDDDNAFYKNGRGTDMLTTHFKVLASGSSENGAFLNGSSNAEYLFLIPQQTITTLEDFRKWLQMEYAKGTPVMVIYCYEDDKVENVAAQSLPNNEGEVTITRDALVAALPMSVTLEVEKVSGEGGDAPKEITFTISDYQGEDRTFTAPEGMTWREFCDSEYNSEGWEIYLDNCVFLYEGEGWGNTFFMVDDRDKELDRLAIADDVIRHDGNYTTYQEGGIGGGW